MGGNRYKRKASAAVTAVVGEAAAAGTDHQAASAAAAQTIDAATVPAKATNASAAAELRAEIAAKKAEIGALDIAAHIAATNSTPPPGASARAPKHVDFLSPPPPSAHNLPSEKAQAAMDMVDSRIKSGLASAAAAQSAAQEVRFAALLAEAVAAGAAGARAPPGLLPAPSAVTAVSPALALAGAAAPAASNVPAMAPPALASAPAPVAGAAAPRQQRMDSLHMQLMANEMKQCSTPLEQVEQRDSGTILLCSITLHSLATPSDLDVATAIESVMHIQRRATSNRHIYAKMGHVANGGLTAAGTISSRALLPLMAEGADPMAYNTTAAEAVLATVRASTAAGHAAATGKNNTATGGGGGGASTSGGGYNKRPHEDDRQRGGNYYGNGGGGNGGGGGGNRQGKRDHR